MEYIKSLYDNAALRDLYQNKRYEYFAGNSIDSDTTVSYKAEADCVIPVKAESGCVLHIVDEGQPSEIIFDGEKSMNARWFRINAGKELSFSSNKKFFMGKPISLIQEQTHKYKFVLFVVVDSLAQTVLEEDGFKELMPHTSAFFSDAIYMRECYCCSDWTLPACATIFTGKYPCEHKMLHPAGGKLQHETFVKLFRDAGYLTSFFNSNWRMPPEYGYINDYDRGVYRVGLYRGKCVDLIENMMDHLYAFPDRDHFITLGLMDLHEHFLTDIPLDIGVQLDETLVEHSYCKRPNLRLNDKVYNPTLSSIYRKMLKFIDYKMQSLYSFVSSKYNPSEYVVMLCGDHGAPYLAPSDFEPTHVPSAFASPKRPSKFGMRVLRGLYEGLEPLRAFFGTKDFLLPLIKIWRSMNLPGRLYSNPVVSYWPAFQATMQKTPMFIKAHSIDKEDIRTLTELRRVYDVFSYLLRNPESFGNEEIKEICRCPYVYNESIYPGQTYKARIIDDQYILFFESDDFVSKTCTLDNLSGRMTLYSRENNERLPDNSAVFEKYASVIHDHISQLH